MIVGIDVIWGAGERLLGLVSTLPKTMSRACRRRLIGGGELTARAAPRGPSVNENDVVLGHGLLEGVSGEVDGGQGLLGSMVRLTGPYNASERRWRCGRPLGDTPGRYDATDTP